MRAGVWFAAGATAGVYGLVRVRRLAEAFTPDGMRDRVGAIFVGARLFREEVARGQAEAEVQLRRRLDGLDAGPRRLAPAGAASSPLSSPTDHPLSATSPSTTADPAAHTQEGPS